jgi:hypothetical protein
VYPCLHVALQIVAYGAIRFNTEAAAPTVKLDATDCYEAGVALRASARLAGISA